MEKAERRLLPTLISRGWAAAFVAVAMFQLLAAAGSATDFDTANQLYDQGRYSDAKELYEKLANDGEGSANVFYDLGNTEYRLGSPGREGCRLARCSYSRRCMLADLLLAHLRSRLPAALDLLRRMVEINSFTANAAGIDTVAAVTAEAFAPLGFRAEFVPADNPAFGRHLFLNRPGPSARHVALVSHLNTVFPPEEEVAEDFRWRREGGYA